MARRVAGFSFSGVSAGIKRRGRLDLGLIAGDGPLTAAAVFTRSHAAAAPVLLARQRVAGGTAGAVLVNSGNANACTGARGLTDARSTTAALAKRLGVDEVSVLPASTGVIGAPLPAERIRRAAPALVAGLRPDGIDAFAQAILTTDSGPKVASTRGEVGGRRVTVLGVAKGAGMIMPDMATMLAFVCTDARVTPAALRRLTAQGVDETFNAITVDGDTSTNDAVFVLASGRAGNRADPRRLAVLVERVMRTLALEIVADGEGASHVVEFRIRGARSRAEADQVARRVANSPLVKTAIHGRDPNWGRIVGAAATAGLEVDPSRMDLDIGPVAVLRAGRWRGERAEAAARKVMARARYRIDLHLHRGRASRSVWGCDLSADYVRINAGYRS